MGKKLAIQGHPTRSKEVIKILEMLGGVAASSKGFMESYCYYVSENIGPNYISWDYIGPEEIDKYEIFTLEEFLEKYPFYNGDKVFDIADGDPGIISAMKWDEDVSDMKYQVWFDNGNIGWYTNDTIDFYLNKDNKEMNGNIETNQRKVNGLKRGDEYPIMEGVECNECIKYYFPDGYEFVDTDDTGVYLKPIKPKYPTNYQECCDVLGLPMQNALEYINKDCNKHDCYNDLQSTLNCFVSLKICRDAYWKIAGEEMGLGKPWEPNWTTFEGMPAIFRFRYNIVCDYVKHQHCLLVFPTEDMRDTFYENLKDLIEQCKELL